METSFEDFVFNSEESYFNHVPSDFNLDGDFVILFPYDDVKRLFAIGSGGYNLTNEVIDQLRSAVNEFRETKLAESILASQPQEM